MNGGQKDLLTTLVGLVAAKRRDAPALRHRGFADWLSRDAARASGDSRALWTNQRVDQLAAEITARIEAATLAVRRVSGPPEVRCPPVTGVVGRVLERAAAEGCAPWLDLAIAAGAGRDLWDEACESWVVVPDGLRRGGGQFVALTVAGDSMTPLLHSGDVVLVKLGCEVVRDTMVVARRPDDGFVVKQVGATDAVSVELRSLNPLFPPITLERSAHTVVGTVVLRWCAHEVSAARCGER